jgi:hypothetical protein
MEKQTYVKQICIFLNNITADIGTAITLPEVPSTLRRLFFLFLGPTANAELVPKSHFALLQY